MSALKRLQSADEGSARWIQGWRGHLFVQDGPRAGPLHGHCAWHVGHDADRAAARVHSVADLNQKFAKERDWAVASEGLAGPGRGPDGRWAGSLGVLHTFSRVERCGGGLGFGAMQPKRCDSGKRVLPSRLANDLNRIIVFCRPSTLNPQP